MDIDDETHEALAKQLNNEVWNLLQKENRSSSESNLMVHTAHASQYHWLHAGTRTNEQRGEWLLSRVYAKLGLGEPALKHAIRCRELTEQFPEEMQDFDVAYSCESFARAHAILGNSEAKEWRTRARELGDRISDAKDKQFFDADFVS